MHTLPRKRFFLVLVSMALALGLGACASAPSGGGGSATASRRNSNRIEADEIATVAELDVYTAINRLRPSWLRSGSHGTLPEVIVDGSPQSGGPEVLRNYQADGVMLLEYMSPSDATTRYGTGYTGGAIIVTTRR